MVKRIILLGLVAITAAQPLHSHKFNFTSTANNEAVARYGFTTDTRVSSVTSPDKKFTMEDLLDEANVKPHVVCARYLLTSRLNTLDQKDPAAAQKKEAEIRAMNTLTLRQIDKLTKPASSWKKKLGIAAGVIAAAAVLYAGHNVYQNGMPEWCSSMNLFTSASDKGICTVERADTCQVVPVDYSIPAPKLTESAAPSTQAGYWTAFKNIFSRSTESTPVTLSTTTATAGTPETAPEQTVSTGTTPNTSPYLTPDNVQLASTQPTKEPAVVELAANQTVSTDITSSASPYLAPDNVQPETASIESTRVATAEPVDQCATSQNQNLYTAPQGPAKETRVALRAQDQGIIDLKTQSPLPVVAAKTSVKIGQSTLVTAKPVRAGETVNWTLSSTGAPVMGRLSMDGTTLLVPQKEYLNARGGWLDKAASWFMVGPDLQISVK